MVSPSPDSSITPARPFTVLTLNLWNVNHWRDRREEVVRWLEELRPDVVGLQEVVRTSSDSQADWLGERAGLDVAFAGVAADDGTEFGNAILSRFPILATDAFPLPALDQPSEGRLCLRAEIGCPWGRMYFFTTHLNYLFDHGWVREAQVLRLSEILEASATGGYPHVLVGDFNAVPDSSEIRYLKGRTSLRDRSFHLFDSHEVAHPDRAGYTWDNDNPFAATNRVPNQRIDYIFVGVRSSDGAGQVLSSRVVCDRPLGATWASDHFGVLTELAIPPLETHGQVATR